MKTFVKIKCKKWLCSKYKWWEYI